MKLEETRYAMYASTRRDGAGSKGGSIEERTGETERRGRKEK